MKIEGLKRERLMGELMVSWNEQVSDGLMSCEDMEKSLRMQISGELDLSGDELTNEWAKSMGWDLDDMTDDQWDAWKDLVNETARRYLGI